MTSPLQIGQPSLALSLGLVNNGVFPQLGGGPLDDSNVAIAKGFVVTTAFETARLANQATLLPEGQTLSVESNSALFSLMYDLYGGDGRTTFDLPDLVGAVPLYLTASSSVEPLWAKVSGTDGNAVSVMPAQLPASLGGAATPIDNQQFGVGMEYLIRTAGDFPSGSAPMFTTIGTVHPFAANAYNQIPSGFMRADGSLLSIADYPELFSVLGSTYGGDGRVTFALPDLRNRVPIGTGTTQDGLEIGLGQLIGSDQIQLTSENVQGLSGIDTMQPSIGMHYLISTSGQYLQLPGDSPTLGQVMLYAGLRFDSNADWVFARGQAIEIDQGQNQALYSLLGTTYGEAPEGYLRLPDLTGRTVIGASASGGAIELGQTSGLSSVSFTPDNAPDVTVPTPTLELVDLQGESFSSTLVDSPFQAVVRGTLWPEAVLEYSTDGRTWSQDYTLENGINTIWTRQVDILGNHSESSEPVTFVLDLTTFESVYEVTNPDAFGYLPQLETFDGLACTPTSITNALVYLYSQGGLSEHVGALSGYDAWVSVRDTLATDYLYTSPDNGAGLPAGTLPAQVVVGLPQYLQAQRLSDYVSIAAIGVSTDSQGNNIAGWGTAADPATGRPAIGTASSYWHIFTEGAVTGEFLRAALLRSDAVIAGGFYTDTQGNPEGHSIVITGLNWTDKNANGVMDASDGAQMTVLDPLDPAQAYTPAVGSDIGYGSGDTAQEQLNAALNEVKGAQGPSFKTGDVYVNDAGMLVFSYQQLSLENLDGTLSLASGDSSNGRTASTDMTIMLAMSLGTSGLPNNIDEDITFDMPAATFQFAGTAFLGKDLNGKIYTHEESAFSNTLQFYRIESADGAITDPVSGQRLLPGDVGYAAAALQLAEDDILSLTPRFSGDFEQFQDFDLSNIRELLIAPVVTTSEQNHWFAFERANSDGKQHFRELSPLTYGMEDQVGLGDADFDDLVFQIIPMQMVG